MPAPTSSNHEPLEAPAYLGRSDPHEAGPRTAIALRISSVFFGRYFAGTFLVVFGSLACLCAFGMFVASFNSSYFASKNEMIWVRYASPVVFGIAFAGVAVGHRFRRDTGEADSNVDLFDPQTAIESYAARPLPDESRAVRCPFCGATYEGPPGDEVGTCPRCGRPTP